MHCPMHWLSQIQGHRFNQCLCVCFNWSQLCTDLLFLVIGLIGGCIPTGFVQLVAAVRWIYTSNIFYLYFSIWFGHLDSELDILDIILDAIHGTYKSYKYDLTNLLVPLIMLPHNHQNYKLWPNGAMFYHHYTYNFQWSADDSFGLFLVQLHHTRWAKTY